MDIRYDLHSHSTASDGTLNPTALLERARAADLDVLALTDHDTLAGIAEADIAAQEAGLFLIPGVEISVSWRNMTIHVLGLNVNPGYQPLLDGLVTLQEHRIWRAEEIARKLEKNGIAGALAGAKKHCKGKILSRTHFAHFLVEAGRATSIRDVFKHFLVRGKPGFVGGEWASMEDALRWIIEAGGLPVIAHPARYGLTRTKLERLVDEFREAGGVGLEVVSGSQSRDETLHMAAVTRTKKMFASCGSDYHGPEKPWVDLGRLRELPDGCTPIWHADSWPVAA
ncbi:FIG00031715: Predicted metal-dependent phosphoesterases (PHP family) [hydrothermal vent metagenome]|uniref:FIG00031715: Predicted metal-dependent phosphoesterases (PHP family) n=1 Tax=hydrothermal vent metagenome TaxID=652676 RepID=A0A3B0YV49_9ZZZZ